MSQTRFIALSILVSLSTLLFTFCKHDPLFTPVDPVDPVVPVDPVDSGINTGWPCSPDTVYFQNQVLPLFISKCTQSGCHDVASHQDGIILTDYERIMSTGKIKAFRPEDSKLYDVLIDTDPDDRMPQPPNQPLSAAEIALVRNWIAQGARNTACNENYVNCDTAGITYANFIQPLLASRCTGCHGGQNPQGNLRLTTFDEVKVVALNGALYGALSHAPNYSAMPKGGAALPACTLDKIAAWINSGLPQ